MKAFSILFNILIFLVLFSINGFSCPSPSEYISLKQPDGTIFKAEKFNDEFREYLRTNYGEIILNKNDNFYYYAQCDENGNLLPTENKVGNNDDIIADKLMNISIKMIIYSGKKTTNIEKEIKITKFQKLPHYHLYQTH